MIHVPDRISILRLKMEYTFLIKILNFQHHNNNIYPWNNSNSWTELNEIKWIDDKSKINDKVIIVWESRSRFDIKYNDICTFTIPSSTNSIRTERYWSFEKTWFQDISWRLRRLRKIKIILEWSRKNEKDQLQSKYD